MKILLGFAFALLPLSAFAEGGDASGQTQTEMTREAVSDLNAADATLDEVYRELKSTLDEEGAARLKAAQKAWRTYRDAETVLETASTEGGSLHAAEVATVKARLTESRIAELRNLLPNDENDDVPRDANGNPYGHGYNPEGTDDPNM